MTNPFRGLLPFEEEHAALFFGRDREIRDIAAHLETRRLLAVTGVSGSGKSSLVRAGVIPMLRAGLVKRLGTNVRVAKMKPGGGPLAALRESIAAALGRNVTAKALTGTTYGLLDVVKRLGKGKSLLLLVDQFEELLAFRRARLEQDEGAEADRFVALLLRAVEQPEVPICVILTMRSDYLGECAIFRDLPEALNDGHYLTPRMTRGELREAIESPIEVLGGGIDPSVVHELLNRCAEEPDALPVLQHVLRRMGEEKIRAATPESPMDVSLADYEDAGGYQGAINQDAELMLDAFPGEHEAIRKVFQRITDKGVGERAVRKPETIAVLASLAGLDTARLRDVVNAFAARDLLTLTGEGETAIVDLPHECLAWKWKRLGEWIGQEADAAARLRFVRDCAIREISLSGLALREALELMGRINESPAWGARYLSHAAAQSTAEWIAASERQEVARLEHAIQQQRNTEAREVAAWSAATLTEDPERSLILGFHSWAKQNAMVPGLQQFLHNALLNSRSRLTLQHQAEVSAVQWSPDGRRLATASRDALVTLWDAESGVKLRAFGAHASALNDLQWSPDGSRIATAGDDKMALVLDAETGRVLLVLSGHDAPVNEVAWSPDGRCLATAGADHLAKIWDAEKGHELASLSGHFAGVWGLAWSPDGRRLATVSRDKTGRIWDAASFRPLLTLEWHEDDVYSVAWSPDGRRVATSGRDRTAKLWDAETGATVLNLPGHRDAVDGIACSPNGVRLATASRDKTARIWDIVTGRELLLLQGHHGSLTRIVWSPDGMRVATSSADSTAKVWDVRRSYEWQFLQSHLDTVYRVAWSPDGSRLATGSADRTATVWEVASGRAAVTFRGHSDGVWCVAWSPDGSRLATASSDRTARIWDAVSGIELSCLEGHDRFVWDVAWSADGARLATASRDGTARIWDADSGRELCVLHGHDGAIRNVAWSPLRRLVATGGTKWPRFGMPTQAGSC